jgi:hypothetical protein
MPPKSGIRGVVCSSYGPIPAVEAFSLEATIFIKWLLLADAKYVHFQRYAAFLRA